MINYFVENFEISRKMFFDEQPKVFINEYYNQKRNQIDLNCEKLISKTKDDLEIQSLNELRMQLIDKIDSVKQIVSQRFDELESKYTPQMLAENTQHIKDEIFLDKYCLVLEVYKVIPFYEFKLGILLFTEFDDQYLDDLKFGHFFV